MNLKQFFFVFFLRATSVAGEKSSSNLRGEIGNRLLQICVAPGVFFPCADDPQNQCTPCCAYDRNDPTVYLTESEISSLTNTTLKASLVYGCHSFLNASGSATRCACGPRSTTNNSTDTSGGGGQGGGGRVDSETPSPSSSSSESGTGAPSAPAPSDSGVGDGRVVVTEAPSSAPGSDGSGRVDCLPVGNIVASDPTEVCDYRSCCSNFCGCNTFASGDSTCRCS